MVRVRAAIRKRIHIFKLPPFARDFGEAAELCQLSKDNKVTFVIASPLMSSTQYADFKKAVERQDHPRSAH